MAAIWPGHWGYTPILYEKCHVFFNTLENIYDERGLRTFRDLQSCYNLPGFSCFFYLQLRSSLKAYGVPWDRTLTSHPIAHWFETLKVKTIKVSLIYGSLVMEKYGNLGITRIWDRELGVQDHSFDWELMWQNISASSKNPVHQLINYNVVHRIYYTPLKRFRMKLISSPVCVKCNNEATGIFFHVFWECLLIFNFLD